ncbi:MAG: glycosyltransferase family 39 protein [Candidatus Omnitrophota bacterium]
MYIFDEEARIRGALYFHKMIFVIQDGFWKKLEYMLHPPSIAGHPRFLDFVGAWVTAVLKTVGVFDVRWLILWTNAVFMCVAGFSIYGIGRILYDRATGLLAVFLLFSFPFVMAQTRVFMLDSPLMSMVALTVLMLLKTRQFSSWRYSVLLGVCAGLAQLTKETAVIFLFPLAIFYLVVSWRSGDRRRCVKNAALAFCVGVILAGVVYFRPDNWGVLGRYLNTAWEEKSQSCWYYLLNFENCLGLGLLLLGVPFFLMALVRCRPKGFILLFWFMVPVMIYSFFPSKALRYLLPVMPALALILAAEMYFFMRSMVVRYVIMVVVLVAVLVQYRGYNNGVIGFTKQFQGVENSFETGRLMYQFDPKMLVVDQLYRAFKSEEGSALSPGLVLVLFNDPKIYGSLRIRCVLDQAMMLDIICPTEMSAPAISRSPWKGRPDEILQAAYVMVKTGGERRRLPLAVQKIEDGLKAGFDQYKDRFAPLVRVPVPDNSYVIIYKKVR